MVVDLFSKAYCLILFPGLLIAFLTTESLFQYMFYSIGLPEDIVTDWDAKFTSQVWEACMESLGVNTLVHLSSELTPFQCYQPLVSLSPSTGRHTRNREVVLPGSRSLRLSFCTPGENPQTTEDPSRLTPKGNSKLKARRKSLPIDQGPEPLLTPQEVVPAFLRSFQDQLQNYHCNI